MHHFYSAIHLLRVANTHDKFAGTAFLLADRTDRRTLVAQGIAHFWPEAFEPSGIDFLELHLAKQMRTTTQIKSKIDQPRRKEGWPACGLLPRLLGVIVGFNLAIEAIGQGKKQPKRAGRPNHDPLPTFDMQHLFAPGLRPVLTR